MGGDDRAKSNGPEGGYPILEAIARKCALFGIDTELEGPDESIPGEPAMLWVAFPEDEVLLPDGSPEHTHWIDDGPVARFALAAPFERYRGFRGRFRASYDAMWSRPWARWSANWHHATGR